MFCRKHAKHPPTSQAVHLAHTFSAKVRQTVVLGAPVDESSSCGCANVQCHRPYPQLVIQPQHPQIVVDRVCPPSTVRNTAIVCAYTIRLISAAGGASSTWFLCLSSTDCIASRRASVLRTASAPEKCTGTQGREKWSVHPACAQPCNADLTQI